MLPDGPPPVPKHKYFKKINKTDHFSVFIPLYLQHQPTCCSAIFFWLLKYFTNNYLQNIVTSYYTSLNLKQP
jgi:hypothetical protein